MSNNLQVKITADVVELQTKFAIAKAEVSGLTAEMNKLARASAGGLIDSAGTARLQQLASDMLTAKGTAAGYAEALAAAGVSTSGLSSKVGEAHGGIGIMARELRSLSTELSNGELTRAPVTFGLLAEHMLGLGAAALAGVAGAAALAAGLGYLAYQAIATSNALDHIDIESKFKGNLDLTRSAIQQFVAEMATANNISKSDATEIAGTFASMKDTSATQIHALTEVISDFATATGQKAPKAAEELARAFDNSSSAEKFASTLGGVTQAELNAAQVADKSGDAQAIFASKFQMLDAALARSRGAIDAHNASMFSSVHTFMQYIEAFEGGASADQEQTEILARENAQRKTQLQLLQQTAAAIANTPASPEQTLKTGVQAAESSNPVSQQADDAKAKIAEMTAALQVAKQAGDQVSIDKLNAGLSKTQEELNQIQFGPVLERMRSQMEQLASTWDGTQSGLLAKQIEIGQQTLSSVQANSKEYIAIQSETARLEVQQRAAAGNEIIANARTQIAAIGDDQRVGALARLEDERGIWSQILEGEHLTAEQRLEVQRSLNADLASIERERVSEANEIAKSNVDTDIAISRMQLTAAKDALNEGVAANRAALNARYAAEVDLTNQLAALDLQQLQNYRDSLDPQSVAYAQVCNQIRELQAKLNEDLAGEQRQYISQTASLDKQQVSQWKTAVGEIESVEGTFVGDMIGKRKTLSQSLLQIGAQLLEKEITNDLKAMTTRILMNNTTEAASKAADQGGFLYHLLFQNQATSATAASQTAQTSATIAGVTARTSAEQSGAAAERATAAATGGPSVMADAAKAFSATYAGVAQIPYVGWILAPAAAAAAFAAVAAYEGLASLDTGTMNIPQTGLYNLHQGEAVVPKTFAEGMRSGGGVGGSTQNNTTHNYGGTINVSDTKLKAMLSSRGNQRQLLSSLGTAYRRGARA